MTMCRLHWVSGNGDFKPLVAITHMLYKGLASSGTGEDTLSGIYRNRERWSTVDAAIKAISSHRRKTLEALHVGQRTIPEMPPDRWPKP